MEHCRSEGDGSISPEVWVDEPAPLSDATLAVRAVRQAALAANFCANVAPYISGEGGDVELRPHQPGVMSDSIDDPTAQLTVPGQEPHDASPDFGYTAASLREKYRHILSILELRQLTGTKHYRNDDDMKALVAMVNQGKTEARKDVAEVNDDIIERAEVAKEILIHVHYECVEMALQRYWLPEPHEDTLRIRAMKALEKAIDKFETLETGGISSYIFNAVEWKYKDILKSDDFKKVTNTESMDADMPDGNSFIDRHTKSNSKTEDTAVENLQGAHTTNLVGQLLQSLNDGQHTVLSLFYGLEGNREHTDEEIAQIMNNQKANAVKASRQRAKHRLYEIIQRQYPGTSLEDFL